MALIDHLNAGNPYPSDKVLAAYRKLGPEDRKVLAQALTQKDPLTGRYAYPATAVARALTAEGYPCEDFQVHNARTKVASGKAKL